MTTTTPHAQSAPQPNALGLRLGPRLLPLMLVLSTAWPTAQTALASPAPQGQSYRCQQAGQTVYSQQPCAPGQAHLLRVQDHRTDQQIREATTVSERQGRLARQLEKQRLSDERQARHHTASALTVAASPARTRGHAGSPSTQATRPASSDHATAQRIKRHRHFTALVPKTPK